MSEKTEIKLQIIVLCKSDTIHLEEDEKREDSLDFIRSITLDPLLECENFPEMVSQYMPDAKMIEPVVISVADCIITKILLATCKNKADIVFITGELADKANETIQMISVNHEELPTKLVRLMMGIEDQLEEITCYRPQCGIRNKTLFINLSGIYVNKEECLAAISDMLMIIIYLIRERENQYSFPEQNINDNANNCHKKLFPLLSIQSVVKILIDVADKGWNERTTELVKISDAYGRILWKDVYSKCNVPPFRTSSKHGYAVLVKDGKGLRKVQKEENVFPPIPLQPGTCVWVNSGAPIPEGATAVVPVKDTKLLEEFSNDDSKCIEIMIKPLHGQNIKTVGYDIMKDKIIIKKFKRIGSEEIGILAATGCKEVVVVKQLSIGVLSIGENLEEYGAPLNPGFTYDINRITLISLLKHNGYSSLDFGIVRDKLSFIREEIEKALRIVDVLVTTGCINDKDLLKNILMKDFKAKIHFGNINVKPGKSTTLASCKIEDKTKYFMCLSGNPTSAYIAAHLFLLPFVNRLHCNIFSESAIVVVKTEDSFLLHQRPRLALTCLRWSGVKESIATASTLSNLYKDRLCDIINANALLILPEKKEKIDLLSESNAPALLIDHPRNG